MFVLSWDSWKTIEYPIRGINSNIKVLKDSLSNSLIIVFNSDTNSFVRNSQSSAIFRIVFSNVVGLNSNEELSEEGWLSNNPLEVNCVLLLFAGADLGCATFFLLFLDINIFFSLRRRFAASRVCLSNTRYASKCSRRYCLSIFLFQIGAKNFLLLLSGL